MDPPEIFFIVGPTAVGKTSLALEVARLCQAEIVNADAFQIYKGLDILTGKPEQAQQLRVRHHLLGIISPAEEMSAGKFRLLALDALADISRHGQRALFVGGTGLYVKTLTDRLDEKPPPDHKLRAELAQLSLPQLQERLRELDPIRATQVDLQNHRRVTRAIEIAAGKIGTAKTLDPLIDFIPAQPRGVMLVRDRDDLYRRINERVNKMFAQGVEKEVCTTGTVGLTARRAIGFEDIQQLAAGAIARDECIARMQQATRRYAKRQLTWFRGQTTFPQLNLTALSQQEAINAIRNLMRPAQG